MRASSYHMLYEGGYYAALSSYSSLDSYQIYIIQGEIQ